MDATFGSSEGEDQPNPKPIQYSCRFSRPFSSTLLPSSYIHGIQTDSKFTKSSFNFIYDHRANPTGTGLPTPFGKPTIVTSKHYRFLLTDDEICPSCKCFNYFGKDNVDSITHCAPTLPPVKWSIKIQGKWKLKSLQFEKQVECKPYIGKVFFKCAE